LGTDIVERYVPRGKELSVTIFISLLSIEKDLGVVGDGAVGV
jgi:hypothetical protein